MGTLHKISSHLHTRCLHSSPLFKTCNMKSFFVAICCLALASAIEVKICDNEITEAHFDNLDIAVDPDPIVVEAGKQVGLHFAIDLLTQMNGGTVKIDIVSGVLPVPCLEVEGHKVGSCEYTTEELVGAFCQLCEAVGTCEELLPGGQACALPAMPGHYGGGFGGDDFVYIDLPELPSELIPLLTGTLKAHILGKDSNDAEDLCADVTIEVVAG